MSDINFYGLIYPVKQVNGQRISGPPRNCKMNEPSLDDNEVRKLEIPKMCTIMNIYLQVYVANLPKEYLEEELLYIFSYYGPIYKLRIMMRFSGENRGFAYVLYYTPEAAQRCAKM